MRRAVVAIWIVSVIVAASAFAHNAKDNEFTLQKPNGRWWKRAQPEERLTFVNGIIEGMFLTGS